jgi:hypothetical protein
MSRIKWVVLCSVLVGLVFLLYPSVVKVRDGEAWVRSAVSLKEIAIALHNYHSVHDHFPPAVVRDKNGQPLYSWRVLLLPYLEQDILYRKFKLDEPWDSPHNSQFLEPTPKCYVPRFGGNNPPGMTRYQVFVGPGTVFEHDGLTLDDITDGTAETLLVVEAGDPVPWSKPEDLTYSPDVPLPSLGGVFTKPVHFLGREIKRKPGFVAVFVDGTPRFIADDTDEVTIRSLITRNGGEKVDMSKLK